MKSNTKMMLAVGSLLILLTVVPGVRWTGIVGIVLFLMGMYQLSQEKSDATLFNEALWAFLIPIIGGVVLSVIGGVLGIAWMGTVWGTLGMGMGRGMGPRGIDTLFSLLSTGSGIVFVLLVILFLLAGWALAVVYGVRMQKVSLFLESHAGNASFKTAGVLFFWGGWLAIIGVGILLAWIGWLLYTIAFFSLPGE